MFKRLISAFVLTLAIVLNLSACSPSEVELQKAVEAALSATQDAQSTSTSIPTPINTDMPVPTNTPRPTATQLPTATPFPPFEPSIIALGRRCIDSVTGASWIFQKEFTEALWGSLEPNLQGFIDITADEEYGFVLFYSYVADDWLFIDQIIFNADGNVYSIAPDEYSTDVWESGSIYESGYKVITRTDFDLIESIIDAEEVLVRFSGSDGLHDYPLTDEEKGTIEYSLVVYQGLINGAVSPSEFGESCPN